MSFLIRLQWWLVSEKTAILPRDQASSDRNANQHPKSIPETNTIIWCSRTNMCDWAFAEDNFHGGAGWMRWWCSRPSLREWNRKLSECIAQSVLELMCWSLRVMSDLCLRLTRKQMSWNFHENTSLVKVYVIPLAAKGGQITGRSFIWAKTNICSSMSMVQLFHASSIKHDANCLLA
jgi:hypothetical protein